MKREQNYFNWIQAYVGFERSYTYIYLLYSYAILFFVEILSDQIIKENLGKKGFHLPYNIHMFLDLCTYTYVYLCFSRTLYIFNAFGEV